MAIATGTMTGACAAHAQFGLAEFVASILAQSRLSKSVFVYALLYTHRFANAQSARVEEATGIPVGCGKRHDHHEYSGGDYSRVKVDALPTCAHCVFLGTLMIAFKFTNDNCYKIKYWAEWAKLTRAEIVQLETKILTALNYECAASQDSFDRWAQVYSSHSARPGSTSLYSAIILYVQAIRRLQSVTLALTVQRTSQQFARQHQHQHPCARDTNSGMTSPSNDSGIFSSTDASPLGPASPAEFGIVTPPTTPPCALPGGSRFVGYGNGNVNNIDAPEMQHHHYERRHSDAYHYPQAPTPPVADDVSSAPSTVISRPCSVPPKCHFSGDHYPSSTATAYPTPASRIGSVPSRPCLNTYGATLSGTVGSLSMDDLYSGSASYHAYHAPAPAACRRASASSTSYLIYPPTSSSSMRHAPYYRTLRPRPGPTVVTPAPVQALYGAWC